MTKAEPLYRLQLLDNDLDKARKQLREIDAALASNPAVNHAQAELAAAQQGRARAAAEVKSLELEAGSLDDKLKEDEGRLYAGNIKNPKEMIDLQREVELLKKRRAELDETILMAMLVLEEALAVEKNCQAALDQATRHWQEDNANQRQTRDQVNDRISADEEKREAVCIAIPRTDLEAYNTLRARRAGGIAVASIKGGACSQCGESPSSVLLQQARTGSSLALCSGCGRILFAG
jgi:predicted  nucleic acid-binding Zn-ribbon protein